MYFIANAGKSTNYRNVVVSNENIYLEGGIQE